VLTMIISFCLAFSLFFLACDQVPEGPLAPPHPPHCLFCQLDFNSPHIMAAGSMLDPSSAEHPKKRSSLDYIMTNMVERPASPTPRDRVARKLILCFDGTGNKFHGDESDSNILKIFRMLDRTADDQYHYYQRKSFDSSSRRVRTHAKSLL